MPILVFRNIDPDAAMRFQTYRQYLVNPQELRLGHVRCSICRVPTTDFSTGSSSRMWPVARSSPRRRQLGVASAFPGWDVPIGGLAWDGRREARSTKELPFGRARTA